LDWLFAADNPNNQKSENKMWIPRPFLTKILTHNISYYLTYLWLFDDYLMIICDYLNSRIGTYVPIREFVIIWWLFVIIEVIWSQIIIK